MGVNIGSQKSIGMRAPLYTHNRPFSVADSAEQTRLVSNCINYCPHFIAQDNAHANIVNMHTKKGNWLYIVASR